MGSGNGTDGSGKGGGEELQNNCVDCGGLKVDDKLSEDVTPNPSST